MPGKYWSKTPYKIKVKGNRRPQIMSTFKSFWKRASLNWFILNVATIFLSDSNPSRASPLLHWELLFTLMLWTGSWRRTPCRHPFTALSLRDAIFCRTEVRPKLVSQTETILTSPHCSKSHKIYSKGNKKREWNKNRVRGKPLDWMTHSLLACNFYHASLPSLMYILSPQWKTLIL